MKYFKITKSFNGYANKIDRTKLPVNFLVEGSQNVLSTDGENIKIREGYTLLGASSTTTEPIESSYDWETHNGVSRNIRVYDDGTNDGTLEVLYESSWIEIGNGYTTAVMNFAEYWDTNEVEDVLLFVNGDANIYAWSGGIAKIGVTTANTIQLLDTTTTWSEERFISNGTDYDKIITINGTDYTYTGGESTDTLTGVTPDPSGEASGSISTQTITTKVNKPASGVKNDLIAVLENQVYIGSLTNRQVFKSAVNDFTDYTYSSPRLTGEGALLTLDSSPTGFIVQEEYLYISAGKDQWYRIIFEMSSDLLNETIFVKRLNTTAQESARSQSSIAKIKNQVVYISNEPTLDSLGRIENVDTPQSVNMSDSIKTDFDGYDFTNTHLKYYKNNLYIALPVEGLVLIYNISKGFWEAPQILPVRRFAIIDGELYGHSSNVTETYKLFDGYNDNENPIEAVAKFAYQDFGARAWLKNFDEHFTEGYISTNTKLDLQLNYDYDGFTSVKEYEIEGDDEAILFQSITDSSLGKSSLGKEPLGGPIDAIEELSKFRIKHTIIKDDFFEVQVAYSTNQLNARWEILSFGSNTYLSTNDSINIKK